MIGTLSRYFAMGRLTQQKATARLRFLSPRIAFLLVAIAVVRGQVPPSHLQGKVTDENGSPLSQVEIVIESPTGEKQIAYTNITGRFVVSPTSSSEYRMTANKSGFFRISKPIVLNEGENNLLLEMNHETEINERVEVISTASEVNPQSTSHEGSLVAREISDIPVPSTHNFRSSLPALPEIIEDNANQIHIAGGRENETQYILDGFDIGDPVTGNLSARLNVDSVRLMETESGHYSSQYGNGGSGVLTLETNVGDDRWRQTLTNFIPGVNTQKQLRFGNWYPRYTLSGPLSGGRAWFSEAISLQRNIRVFSELPQDADTINQWSGDNLIRAQVNLTANNILQGGFLYNQQYASHIGLTPFSPVETTTTLRSHRAFFFIKDQTWTKRTFYEVGVAGDFGHSGSLPLGNQPYIIQTMGASGNYFESSIRKTQRWQITTSTAMPSRHWHGTHNLQAGVSAFNTKWDNSVLRSTIDVLHADNSLVQRSTFSGPSQFHISDFVFGAYIQDAWQFASSFLLQLGLREDRDRIIGKSITSPRLSANFLPLGSDRMKLTAGWGIFAQPLRLAIMGPAFDQSRKDAFYGPAPGNSIVSEVTSRFVLPRSGLKQPWFSATNLAWEQKFGERSVAIVNFTDRRGHSGIAYESSQPDPGNNLLSAANNRRDRYRSIQISFRHTFGENAEWAASYVRSSARTNEIFDYAPSNIVFTPQREGPLPWDAPNHIISSGWSPLPLWHLMISYFLEFRTGFPFSAVNEKQQLVGEANGLRFPDYFSLNVGLEKQVRAFRRRWAVRLTMVNITSHPNPEAVINNVDSPNYLQFSGSQSRAFSARIRLAH
jgi:hypothetical protein